jgi:hypothetical protein
MDEMNEFSIYAICSQRTKKCADTFLNSFVPNRVPLAEEYEFPQYADDPIVIYSAAGDLIERLETEIGQSYSIYWDAGANAISSSISQAILLFTSDGKMIAGLVAREENVVGLLSALKAVVSARWGMVTGDEFPPTGFADFVRICASSSLPRIVDGDLMEQ